MIWAWVVVQVVQCLLLFGAVMLLARWHRQLNGDGLSMRLMMLVVISAICVCEIVEWAIGHVVARRGYP